MVLLGLGILAASLTFLIYRTRPLRWRQLLHFWEKHGEDGRRIGQRRDGDSNEADTKENSVQRESQICGLPLPVITEELPLVDTPEISLQAPLDGASDSKGETSPKANEFRSAAQGQRPILLLDDSDNRRPAFQIESPTSPVPIPGQPKQTAGLLMPPPSLPRPLNIQSQRQLPNFLTSTAPQRSSTFLKPLPKANSALNPPPSAASTLRGPTRGPTNSLTTPKTSSTSQLTSSTLSPNSSAKPSRKVLLSPGHSPLDWAHLTSNPPTPTFLRGASVPPQLIRVPPSLLKYHNGRKGRDAWSTWHGRVYNLTPYLDFHPGGRGELMRGAGKVGEAERLFLEVHPWVNWEGMLGKCLIGVLVEEPEKDED